MIFTERSLGQYTKSGFTETLDKCLVLLDKCLVLLTP